MASTGNLPLMKCNEISLRDAGQILPMSYKENAKSKVIVLVVWRLFYIFKHRIITTLIHSNSIYKIKYNICKINSWDD